MPQIWEGSRSSAHGNRLSPWLSLYSILHAGQLVVQFWPMILRSRSQCPECDKWDGWWASNMSSLSLLILSVEGASTEYLLNSLNTFALMNPHAISLRDLRFRAACGTVWVSRTLPNWNRNVTSGSSSIIVEEWQDCGRESSEWCRFLRGNRNTVYE